MDQRYSLNIAGLPLSVIDDGATPCEWLLDRCAPYHANRPAFAPDVTVAIRRSPGFVFGTDELVCQEGQDQGGFAIRGIDFTATRRRCGLPVEVEAHPEAGMAGILRWVAALLLMERGGLLLHAMAYAFEGSGVVCAGPSGRGKTTLARLLRPHVSLLTDETAAVEPVGEASVVHATPFAGELGIVSGPAGAMLEAVFFLEHGSETRARRMPAAETVARFLGCTFAPLRGGSWMNACLASAERLARQVPCFALQFRPEPSVWETIQDACHRTVPQA